MKTSTLEVDGKTIAIEGERNLLEVIRKAKIELPTFCYHSELSVYGACRLCLVDIAGRGIQPACSTPPEGGMQVRTSTGEIREMRKIVVELLLAGHEHGCPTCAKSTTCQLQSLAKRLGIKEVRFKARSAKVPLDESTPSLSRDPNKCVLCGDCVRVCHEVQGVGAIDFAFRGVRTAVMPAYGKDLSAVDCVNCGQCARVCPTGAITPRSEVEAVWKDLDGRRKTVVAQIAPAVRVALGEMFGLEPGVTASGQMVGALRAMGFAKVFDTAFTADLTVVEEAEEFLARFAKGERLPQFTSCCPGWVTYAEQYHPELLEHLSTCRSPQQMFGALAKEALCEELKLKREDLVVVSIMPCTAKKFEARREEFSKDGVPDVDHVITTQELARMIEERGLQFRHIEPESFDMPFGFKTGAGVIFGNSGGVSEAVLRYAGEKLGLTGAKTCEFLAVRGEQGVREVSVKAGGKTLRLAVVSGLANAKRLIEKARKGESGYDLIEVMACPGGCIGGAGQPVSRDPLVRAKRTKGLYDNDRMLQLHKSQENPYINEIYTTRLGQPGSRKAHELLHTHYKNRKRIKADAISLGKPGAEKLCVEVCFGTNCFMKGAQSVFKAVTDTIAAEGLADRVEVKASFCFEACDKGPMLKIGARRMERCTPEKARAGLLKALGLRQEG
jgi:NADH-quinone oxidoreductase subunit G